VKLPFADSERQLLADLFDDRRVAVTFPDDRDEAGHLHALLTTPGEADLPRDDVEVLTDMLGAYLDRLAGPGAPVPAQAPLDETVALAAHAPTLQHIHAQLVRHLKATA
jgi:hypothetical protein